MIATNTLSFTQLADEDLMELFQNNNERAFNELVKRYSERLHSFLFRYTRNHEDCQDLVQETFMRVYKSRHSYTRIARFSTWMYTIALNLAKSLYKKNQRMQKVSIHRDESDPNDMEILIEDKGLQPDADLHQKFCMEKLDSVLLQVSEEFREVVILRDFQQLSYDEISDMTGLPMGTVKSRINRGRAQIVERMQEYIDSGTFMS